jgi:hypothetical protein
MYYVSQPYRTTTLPLNGKGLSPYLVCLSMGYLASSFIEVHNVWDTSEPGGLVHSYSIL